MKESTVLNSTHNAYNAYDAYIENVINNEHVINVKNVEYELFTKRFFTVKKVLLTIDEDFSRSDTEKVIAHDKKFKSLFTVNNLSGDSSAKVFEDDYVFIISDVEEDILWINLLNEFAHLPAKYDNCSLLKMLDDKDFMSTVESNVDTCTINNYGYYTKLVVRCSSTDVLVEDKENKTGKTADKTIKFNNITMLNYNFFLALKDRDTFLALTPKSYRFILEMLPELGEDRRSFSFFKDIIASYGRSHMNNTEKRRSIENVISLANKHVNIFADENAVSNKYSVNTIFADIAHTELNKKQELVNYITAERSQREIFRLVSAVTQLSVAPYVYECCEAEDVFPKFFRTLNLFGKDYIESRMKLSDFYALMWSLTTKKIPSVLGVGAMWNIDFVLAVFEKHGNTEEVKNAIVDFLTKLNFFYQKIVDFSQEKATPRPKVMAECFSIGVPFELIINATGAQNPKAIEYPDVNPYGSREQRKARQTLLKLKELHF